MCPNSSRVADHAAALAPAPLSQTDGVSSFEKGVVAAGHPLSARAGANVLQEGGNAVDAALGAMLASFACEPLLTGLGAGGYMLVVAPGRTPVLLDFFVEAPGRETGSTPGAELQPVEISFGDALQTFHIGAASVGCYGLPAGLSEAARRFGRVSLQQLVAPAARLAREGVAMTREQDYIIQLLGGIVTSTPECAALFAPHGPLLRTGERMYQPELAETLERLGTEGARPFYEGDIGAAIADWVTQRGGLLGRADLAAYRVVDREPLQVSYRGRQVLTNPPPSAGGILIARALAMLGAQPGPPTVAQIVDVMERTQNERTSDFLAGLDDPGFVARFLSAPLGSTTHIAVLDSEGWACSVTCSNGSASGVVVPGTGVHLNNMLGEQDLNPLGFHRHPPGRRMPSMMAPTVVLHDGVAELAVGSAGSNRIRSAILQTIVRCIDEGKRAAEAVDAPPGALRGRCHLRRAGHRPPELPGRRPRDRPLSGAQPVLRRCPGGGPGERRQLLRWWGPAPGRRLDRGLAVRRRWPLRRGQWPLRRGRWPLRRGRWPLRRGRWPWRRAPVAAVAALAGLVAIGALAGCGLNVQSVDLFLLTRTGQGTKLTLVVNDSGTIRCNGAKARQISSSRLITARDLSDNLAADAGHHLHLPFRPGTVYAFRIALQQGAISFTDRDLAGHPDLAQAVLFATQAAVQVCGLRS